MPATVTPTTYAATIVKALADSGADVILVLPGLGDNNRPAVTYVTVNSFNQGVVTFIQRGDAQSTHVITMDALQEAVNWAIDYAGWGE